MREHRQAKQGSPALTPRETLTSKAWLCISRHLQLSRRELQMVQGVFDNAPEKAIAAALQLSPHTVHAHLNNVYQKLGATTRTELVLSVMCSLIHLIQSDVADLPPICRHFYNGRCPNRKPRSFRAAGKTKGPSEQPSKTPSRPLA